MSKKNILFVDDNANTTQAIQRQLRPYREQWQLFFANSGQQALEILAQQAIDLIVSDMLMPGMKGDELLRLTAARYPSTVRIILSGHADEETLKSALAVAHQYLSKPCSAEILRDTISLVFAIQACTNNPLILQTVGDVNKIPSLPNVYHDLNAAIAKENTTTQVIADIFAQDMLLSANLLHLVNSPYFGLNRVVANLNEAINLVGIKKLSNLVLSVHVRNAFPVRDPVMSTILDYVWQDSSRVAELARLIVLSENLLDDAPDHAYMGGLLHNMGLLILFSGNADKFKQLLHLSQSSAVSIPQLETDLYGFTRSEAAAYLLSLWKIPPIIVEAILLQNRPSDSHADGFNVLTAVHVAASLLLPPEENPYGRLFTQDLNNEYLARINKLDRLAHWQGLADKVQAHFAKK